MAAIGDDGPGLRGTGLVLAAAGVHLADLGILGRDRGWIFATLAIGSTVVPLGAGQLVDRLMATQRLLAMIYAIGRGPAGGPGLGLGPVGGRAVRGVPRLLGPDGAGVQPQQRAGHAQPRRPGPGVRPGAALGDGRLDGRRLGRLAGDGGHRLDPDRPGCVRVLVGRGGVLRGHVDLLLDPAPHAAAGGRPDGPEGIVRVGVDLRASRTWSSSSSHRSAST